MSFVIGEEIKKRVKRKGLKNKAFGDLMNIEERNLYHFFKKEQMDVDQLLLASEILDFNFLSLYIKNSKFKNYWQKSSEANLPVDALAVAPLEKVEPEISFSICIKGSVEKISSEMSNFLQLIKIEAENRGLTLG